VVAEEHGAPRGHEVDVVPERVRRCGLVVLDAQEATPQPASVEAVGGGEDAHGDGGKK
jgi:hypothetical protein